MWPTPSARSTQFRGGSGGGRELAVGRVVPDLLHRGVDPPLGERVEPLEQVRRRPEFACRCRQLDAGGGQLTRTYECRQLRPCLERAFGWGELCVLDLGAQSERGFVLRRGFL